MKKKTTKTIKGIIQSITIITLVFVIGFFVYASQYYKATPDVHSLLAHPNVEVIDSDIIYISSEQDTEIAVVFYPGAKVEYTAYLPLLKKVVDEIGVDAILVKMPFNMAIFDSNRIDDVMDIYPTIQTWYLSGHSMGGAMASNYMASHPDKIEGLILLGSYIYGDVSVEDTLTIYGSLNTSVADKVDYDTNVVIIDGGNHAQFGNYGDQKGDAPATISRLKQQNETVQAIKEFINNR